MSWRLLEGPNLDIYQSLAIEEALARVSSHSSEMTNTVRIWKADRAVVVGRFQCIHKEVNIHYCQSNDISIARRFTGGGTVYQDSGNLNFTICADQRESYVPKRLPQLYKAFVGEIAYQLQKIGIPARFDPQRACLRIQDKKITGTAGWIKQGVSFIHGTLLVNADLSVLNRCFEIPVDQPEYLRNGKKVRCLESKRDTVTNIIEEVPEAPSEEDIAAAIIRSVQEVSGTSIIKEALTKEERDTAHSLYQCRYSLADWNLGTRVPD
ncbi:MAG: lipoate--protein ligase family protein [Candidatus Thorarchaeota archaeon]|nr:MAG: lipoate--protein ligase family protein [Candidatus Thorarchaeota archaeon]